MPKRIYALGLDGFKTTIQMRIPYESPLKEFVTYAYPLKKGEALEVLRPAVLTNEGFNYDDMRAEAERHRIFIENASDFTRGKRAAHKALKGHLHEYTYERNPELDDVVRMAREYRVKLGVISDLAEPFGQILDYYLYDISRRIYSYKLGCVKKNKEPFALFAKKANAKIKQVAFVGDNFIDDYLTPKSMGIESFLYVPDKKAYADKYGERVLEMHENDIVSTLPQVFEKLDQRGYILGS